MTAVVPEVADSTLLTREQAARFLNIRPQTLSAWASTGRYALPFIRVGRCVRYRRADLEHFLLRNTVSSVASETESASC